ncbi:MAG: hypothetical protein SVY15_06950, partial [Halobacteriota archaeon]|nr:hypothetical protein [Halobacteriota archaeon]
VQQKISGTFRSVQGARSFCRIRSYISAVKKNKLSVIDAILAVFDGRPFCSISACCVRGNQFIVLAEKNGFFRWG